MIRSLYRTGAGDVSVDLSPDAFTRALEDLEGLLWVDLCDEPVASCEPMLRQVFGFHPLAVEDALEESHVPRVDDWGQYLYLNLHAIAFDRQAEDRAVITVRETWQDALYAFQDYPGEGGKLLSQRGPYTLDVTYTLERDEIGWFVTSAIYANEPPAW